MTAIRWIFVAFAALAAPAFGQSLAPANVALTPGERTEGAPAVAANPGSSDALLVWSERPTLNPRFFEPGRLMGRLFTPSGPSGEPIEIAGDSAREPAVVFNSARGEYFVAYQRTAVLARRLSADGLVRGPEIAIGAAGTGGGRPAIAYHATADEYLVIWADGLSGTITGQRVDAAGGHIGPARILAASGASSPTVTFNPRTSQYLVVWTAIAPGSGSVGSDVFDVFAQIVERDGTPSGLPFAVIAAKGFHGFAGVAANSTNGRYLVAWNDRKTEFGDADISARVLNSDGSPAGNDSTISTLPFGESGPRIAFLPDRGGRFLVVWTGFSHETTTNTHVFGRVLDGEGAPRGPVFPISGPSGAVVTNASPQAAAVAASPSVGAFLAVWHDARDHLPSTGITREFAAAIPLAFAPDDLAVDTFITRLYLELLERVPSAPQVASGAASLRANPTVAGASAVVHALLDDPQFADLPLSPAGRVTQLYRAVLGREPDPAGLAAYEPSVVAQLDSIVPAFVAAMDVRSLGLINPDNARIVVDRWYVVVFGRAGGSEAIPLILDIQDTRDYTRGAQAFFGSAEYLGGPRTFVDHATLLHRALRGRDPRPAERAGLLNAIRQRFTGVVDRFLGSAEFRSLVADPGDPAAVDTLIRRLYLEALGRAPADSEVAEWKASLLATGDVTGVVHAFFSSAEYESLPRSVPDHVRVLYRALLAREPAAAESSAWVDAFAARLGELIPPLVAAPEFAFVPLVVNLYEIVLRREPSAAELAEWVTYLAATGDVAGVLASFFTSPEYVNQPRRLGGPGGHVELLFRVVQGRFTAPEEQAPFVAIVRSRLASVADSLIGSPEFAARLQAMLSRTASALRASGRRCHDRLNCPAT